MDGHKRKKRLLLHLCHGGNAEVWWDMLLRQGKRVFATAVDDVHVADDSFGGWIWVKAAERSRDAILDALFQGTYYSSTGPEIYDFGLDGKNVYVSCSACREIHFVTYAPRGRSLFAEPDGVLKEACYTLTGRESYVRVVCVDHHGHSACSTRGTATRTRCAIDWTGGTVGPVSREGRTYISFEPGDSCKISI